MLLSMRVKNLALVDDITIHFHDGLNILTGETGAGKSVLINSINLCLGGKANKNMISYGQTMASIELVCSIDNASNSDVSKCLEENGIPLEKDNLITITREIGSKSSCSINGKIVNIKVLQSIGQLLLDAHSQHETSKLLNVSKHIDILDQSFGFTSNNPLKQKSIETYKTWVKLKEELEDAKNQQRASTRELSLAQYELVEIENAAITENEDVELEETYKIMQNSQKIYESVQNSLTLMNNDDSTSIEDLLGQVNKSFSAISNTNSYSEEIYSKIIELEELVRDISYEMNDFLAECHYEDDDMYELEQRLNTINTLKSKYGNSIEQINDYYEQRRAYVEKMENYDEYLEELAQKEEKTRLELQEIHNEITLQRTNAAIELGALVEEAMRGLNFQETKFRVDIKETQPSSNGKDKVEFMVVLNKGVKEQPLAMVASGGELSRVMLALKSVIAKKDGVDTLIFDEIDAGISGNTAWMVGERLFVTSTNKQVISITHLPQIAAFANSHYSIEKIENQGKTYTNIYELDDNGTNLELQRLSGVDNENAIIDLKNKANMIKEKYV